MKIGLRGGHSKNCRGTAYGGRDEYDSMQILYGECKKIFEDAGHIVVDCNSNGCTKNEELSEGVNKANAANVDLFIALHMNACDNHNAYGTEVWVYPGCSKLAMAQRICKNFGDKGFFNRGVKTSTSFYEMRNVKATNFIVETCFIDSSKDMSLWSPLPWNTIARMVCNGVDPSISLETPAISKPVIPESNDEQIYYKVQAGAFRSKSSAEALVKDLESKGFQACIKEEAK